jgi:hypothetical protein
MGLLDAFERRDEGTSGRIPRRAMAGLTWPRASYYVAILATFMGFATLPAAARSRAAHREKLRGQEISGIVTEITPQQMTIQGTKGGPLTLTTSRDYTEDVAFGSDLTATYITRNGVNILESLTPPLENLFVPAYEIRERIHTVIVLPDSSVAGSDEFFDALQRYLRDRLGWYVKPRVLAEEARRYDGPSQSTLGLINPRTGSVDISRYTPGRGDLMRKIAAATRVDAVVDARLVVHSALLDARRRVATWDGYREAASGSGGTGLGRVALFPIMAEIPATTLQIKLWDAQGKPLWSRSRGFAVLYVEEGLLGKLRARPLEKVIENKDEVTQWFNSFFAPLLAPAQRVTSGPHRP